MITILNTHDKCPSDQSMNSVLAEISRLRGEMKKNADLYRNQIDELTKEKERVGKEFEDVTKEKKRVGKELEEVAKDVERLAPLQIVATQVEKDLIDSISIGILSALIEEFLGKPFLPESPESLHSPELGDCIIPNK